MSCLVVMCAISVIPVITASLLMSLREPAVWQTPDVVAAGR
jgi:hypothetical protein